MVCDYLRLTWLAARSRTGGPLQVLAQAVWEAGPKRKKPKVSRNELRDYAMKAFKTGDDVLTFSLKRDGDRVAGSGMLDTGLLRFAGHLIAKFTVTLSDEGTELVSTEDKADE